MPTKELFKSNDLSFIKTDCIKSNIKDLDKILLKSIKLCLSEESIQVFGTEDLNSLQSKISSTELFSDTTKTEASISISVPFDSRKSAYDFPMVITYKIKLTRGFFTEHSLTVSQGYIDFYKERVKLDDLWKQFSSDPQEIQKQLDILISPILLFWIDKARNQK